jgi:hypothetical protein
MKKIILPLAIICLNLSMISQTQRTILYEEFTGENCGPCASTNPSLTTLVHTAGNMPNKIVLVRYQVPIPSAPGAGSLFQDNPTEPNSRITYYSVPFAPYARFDGIVLPDLSGGGNDGHASFLTQQYIDDSTIVDSPFGLNLSYVLNPTQDSVTVTAVITAAEPYNASGVGALRLQIAMEEAVIHFNTAPGTNGEKNFTDIMRKMMPSVSGTALNDSWVTAATQTITITEAIPLYIHDKSQLAFVAFIQDNGPKRVHQAAYAAPLPLYTLDAGINNFVVPVSCSNSYSLTMNLRNHGTQTLTSCTVNYQLDNGPVQTIPYSGSLATAYGTTVVIPTFTASVGHHTFRCYTSGPNGSSDNQTINDTARANFTVYTGAPAPVVEGFETAGSLPNATWDISHTSGGGEDFQVSSAAASTGSNSIKLDNFSNISGNSSIFQTASYYDMTTLAVPALSFDAAYQQKASTNGDKLQILTSTDCGNTWVSRKIITGATLATLAGGTSTSPYVPTPSQFTTYTVNINGVITNHNVLFRWVFIAGATGPGNNLYLDNINIIDASAAGIKNIDMNAELNVYPNPNNGSFVIAFANSAPSASVITVSNMLGEIVLTQSNLKTTNEINLQGISNGSYFVKVQTSDKTYIRKIVVAE